ncbi:MAG: hypothetical protein RLZZ308_524 [Candidatus Parcubacteria bacterium]|jgi:peptidoglycan hydrolase-like protein with peptidoglycan-binding domain
MKTIMMIAGVAGLVFSQIGLVSAGYFNTTPITRCEVQITRNLKRGSENNEVVILQNVLIRAGFLYANPNGYFGYQTESAVRRFQIDNSILGTGIVGPATRNALNERLCDHDVIGMGGSYEGYSSGVTYVSPEDPFVQVVTPQASEPFVYTTPQEQHSSSFLSSLITPVVSAIPTPTQTVPSVTAPVSSSVINPISSTNIVYSPSVGYTYGITPQSGSVTVTSPLPNTTFREGDSVTVRWYTTNLKASTFSLLLENTISGQSKVIAVTSGTSHTFTLTPEILDVVCSGICNNVQTGAYRIVLTTPTTDIAGNMSTLRASVASVTITRTPALAQVSITTSKTPVNSGELFKLYLNIPRGASWNAYNSDTYSIHIRAICPSAVSVSVAGSACGTDFVIPFAPVYFQQEIPVTITNNSWYRQNVAFELRVMNTNGQTIGQAQTTVVTNGAPFNW